MSTHATVVESRSDEQRLRVALAELQATASNFATSCIRDARVRAQYVRDIQATSSAILQAVQAGMLFAFGADLGFGTTYPLPAR